MNNAQKFYLEHKKANMQPVKKVTYTFDPMTPNVQSLRSIMFFWQTKKVKATNVKLITKTEIVDDRREPKILYDLNDGRQLEVIINSFVICHGSFTLINIFFRR